LNAPESNYKKTLKISKNPPTTNKEIKRFLCLEIFIELFSNKKKLKFLKNTNKLKKPEISNKSKNRSF
jgi:hypothetical protein